MRKFASIAVAMAAMVSVSIAQQFETLSKVAASLEPPVKNGVTRANAPQFIVIGSDDNTHAEAVKWMANVISNGKNKDGSARYMSFYSNTRSNDQANLDWSTNTALAEAHKAVYDLGHEVSNHTHRHIEMVGAGTTASYPWGTQLKQRLDISAIYADMKTASDRMVAAGIPKKHQFGFRTPFLQISDSTFSAMVQMGFLYDCSISSNRAPGAGRFPYTLDNIHGAPDASWGWDYEKNPAGNIAPDNNNYWGQGGADKENPNPVRAHPGLWVLPNSNVAIPEEYKDNIIGKGAPEWLTNDMSSGGLDYNLWEQAKLDSMQTVNSLMFTLTQTMAGNRAPFTYGVHSQYYVNQAGTYNGLTERQMKGSFEEFVRKASDIPGVFFVSGDMVIRWMQNPVSAAQFKPEDYLRDGCAHNWVEQSKTDATCDAAGSRTDRCSACQDTRTVDIPKLTNGCGGDFIELIGLEGLEWGVDADTYDRGTEVTFNQFDDRLVASLKLGRNLTPDEYDENYEGPWPYMGLAAYTGSDFSGLSEVEITYNSDGNLELGIGYNDGGANWIFYRAILPAGNHSDRSFAIADFKKPAYGASASAPTDLSLADKNKIMAGVYITHPRHDETVEITITSLKVYLSGGASSIEHKPTNRTTKSAALSITGISAGKLGLTVPTAGNYTVALYSVDGKMIAQTKTNLSRGVNSIPLGRNLAKGVVVVRIQGMNTQLVKKIMVK